MPPAPSRPRSSRSCKVAHSPRRHDHDGAGRIARPRGNEDRPVRDVHVVQLMHSPVRVSDAGGRIRTHHRSAQDVAPVGSPLPRRTEELFCAPGWPYAYLSVDIPIRRSRRSPSGTPVALRDDRWPRASREIRLIDLYAASCCSGAPLCSAERDDLCASGYCRRCWRGHGGGGPVARTREQGALRTACARRRRRIPRRCSGTQGTPLARPAGGPGNRTQRCRNVADTGSGPQRDVLSRLKLPVEDQVGRGMLASLLGIWSPKRRAFG
jgi:hypothetical protein